MKRMEELSGYRGAALKFLKKAGASIGDVVSVKTAWGELEGTVVPRYHYEDGEHIVIKLKSGYNVGLDVSGLRGGSVKAKGEKPGFSASPPPKSKGSLPKVLVVGTGGTIASRVDYRTGAVSPVVSSADLHSLVPELSELARVETEILFNVFSENMRPAHWTKLALRAGKAVEEGFDGVVVTHGTDTLGYTAAALSFALAGVPIPVVIVGAQRSTDRPSSDGPLNLMAGVDVAGRAGFSGVYVAMHMDESDGRVAVHRGTRVRKNHTSRRDAFVSVGVPLAAVWTRSGLGFVSEGLPPRRKGSKFVPRARFEEKVALLKFYPSMPGGFVQQAGRMGMKGIVVEGTGLGHTSAEVGAELGRFTKAGGMVCMTSQCINGRVDMNVYDTGRDLAQEGVVPLEDMLAETALVKAMWALGNHREVEAAKEAMRTNLVGEMTTRTFPS